MNPTFKSLLALAALAVSVHAAVAEDSFPVVIEHALGTTTVEAKPERVVAWGWSAQDVVLDLGLVPVGMPFVEYGGDEEGLLPWTRAAIEATGQPMPVILPEGSGPPPFEAIAALDPDLIVAVYSGISQAEYDTLSQIAPTIAFPEIPWTASWQDVVRMTGQGLGKAEEATKLIDDTEQFLRDEAARYPQISGKSVANFVDGSNGSVSMRKAVDPRSKLLVSLGLVQGPDAGESDPGVFNYLLSYENFGTVDADILVAFMSSPEAAATFFAQPYAARAPQVKQGAYVVIDDSTRTMAVGGAVTPMSLRWALPEFVAAIGKAAAVVGTD